MVSLILWIFIVPCAVAINLVLTFVAKYAPNLYWVCVCLASALATWAIIWASPWIPNSTGKDSGLSSTSRLPAPPLPEQKVEKYFEGDRSQTHSAEEAATASIDLRTVQQKAKAAS